jgi:hypothetical protein
MALPLIRFDGRKCPSSAKVSRRLVLDPRRGRGRGNRGGPRSSLPGFRTLSTTTPPPVVHWLPEFARFLRAPPPPRITEQQARDASGEDAVHYDTKLDGASNEKAKKTFAFAP